LTPTRPKVFKNDGKERFGRGFSREELKKAGSSLKEAVKLGLPVDDKRKTSHDKNVEDAKTFVKDRRLASKPKPKPAPTPTPKVAPKPKQKVAPKPKQKGKPKS
jgi:ribosomal protein L13E